MALKTVKYITTEKLACICAYPAEVYLCITPSKIAPHECSDTVDQTWEYNHIVAVLTDVVKTKCSCNYTYTFSYDEDVLLDGELLYASDISGVVCSDCELTYIKDLVGGEVEFTVEDDGSVTITSQHGCSFNFFPSEGTLAVVDTESVDLTLTGGVSKTLSADVNISADAGNQIEIRADGLFADFSQSFNPPSDDTTDLGSLALRFKNLYLSSSPRFANDTYAQWRNGVNSAWVDVLKLDAVDDVILNASAGNEIRFTQAGLEQWGISATGELEQNGANGSDIIFNAANGVIRQGTSNGADNKSSYLCGGGAFNDRARGSFVGTHGNESADLGRLELRTGDVATADIVLEASDDILFVTNSLNAWRFNGDQSLAYEQANSIIHSETGVGTNTYQLQICGGHTASSAHGSRLEVYGHNHATNAGDVVINAGQAVGASIFLALAEATGLIEFDNAAGAPMWSLNNSGQLVQNGTNGSDIIFNKTQGIIRQDTADGTDNGTIEIYGGHGLASQFGASIRVSGNEVTGGSGVAASIRMESGDSADARIMNKLNNGSARWQVFDASINQELWGIDGTTGALKGGAGGGGNLIFQRAHRSTVDHVTTGISAAGATQGTATLLADTVNVVTVVAAAADGVILPVTVAGTGYYVYNDDSADTLNVYPPSGGEINRAGTDTAVTLASGVGALFKAFSTTEFFTV